MRKTERDEKRETKRERKMAWYGEIGREYETRMRKLQMTHLIVLRDSRNEYHGRHVIKNMHPFGSLVALTTNIVGLELSLLKNKNFLHDA